MAALEPPTDLDPATRTVWVATTAELLAAGTTARVSPASLLAYTSAVVTHQRATTLLAQTDVLIQRGDNVVANPALDIQRQAAIIIERFARQFGLNRRSLTPMGDNDSTTKRGRWCDQHERWECTSNRSKGRGLCHALAAIGIGRCNIHAGVKVSEDANHLLALEQRRNPMAGQPMDIGPAEALLWRVRVLAGEVARLDEVIAGLEADELVWGKTHEVDDDTGAQPGTKTTYGARVNTWLIIRAQRERALQDACEAALRANIEERMVRLAEQQGASIHRLLMNVLTDFGVPLDDPRIGVIVPRRLRELTA